MDLQQVEALIVQASSGTASPADQLAANTVLDKLKVSADSWQYGMRLFLESSQLVARFFGATLVREQLAARNRVPGLHERRQIRESLVAWVGQALGPPAGSNTSGSEPYILSNIASVLSLCVKYDFPEHWPSAFQDLMAIGYASTRGTGLVLTILENFNADVVIFHEDRVRDEWTHNTAIKDTMRNGTNAELVSFLLSRAIALRQSSPETSNNCLNVLALFVSWVDINLVVQQQTLSLLYESLGDSALWEGGCACITEMVKKGMSPDLKLELLETTRVIEVVSHTISKGGGAPVDENLAEHLAPVVDALFAETADVWSACVKDASGTATALIPKVAAALRCVLTSVLTLFSHPNFDVAVCLVEALQRFVGILRAENAQTDESLARDFVARDYLERLLGAIYQQLQFEEDFDFDNNDEDDCVTLEGKKEIRKIFVNIARVFPLECLNLMSASLSSLPFPLSTAPFAKLEAALKLVLAFGDCGSGNSAALRTGNFPQLLRALHESDVAAHAHAQVKLNYFEAAARYARGLAPDLMQHVVRALIGPHGMHADSAQVRCRAAYFFLKVVEASGDAAGSLLPIVGSFADMLLCEAGQPSPLSEPSELYLLQAVGLMTSQALRNGDQQAAPKLLQDMTSMVGKQVGVLLVHPQRAEYSREVGDAVGHKISSLGSLAQGHRAAVTAPPSSSSSSSSSSPSLVVTLFSQAADAVAAALESMPNHPLVRAKCMVFLHRMVPILEGHVVGVIGRCMTTFIIGASVSDVDQAVMLLNQMLEKFPQEALGAVDIFMGPLIDRLATLFEGATCQGATETQTRSDRFSMERQCIAFLSCVSHHAPTALVSPRNTPRLGAILDTVLNALGGGSSGLPTTATISLRRGALAILSNIVVWLTQVAKEGTRAEMGAGGGITGTMRDSLMQLVLTQAVPKVLTFCVSESNSRDASTLSLYADVGGMFHALDTNLGHPGFMSFLRDEALPALSWPPEAIAQILALQEITVPGHPEGGSATEFRDKFKAMLRAFRQS